MWQIKDHPRVNDLSEVPENYRGLYVKSEDGAYVIGPAFQAFVNDYISMSDNFVKTRKDLKAANDESAKRRVTQAALVEMMQKHGAEGADTAEDPLSFLDSFIDGLATKGKTGSQSQAVLDKMKLDYDRRVSQIQKEADERVTGAENTVSSYLIDGAAATALAKNKGSVALLGRIVRDSARVVRDETGKYAVRIIDKDGDPRTNGAGEFLDIEGFVQELKQNPDYAVAFASEVKAGSGTPPGATKVHGRPGVAPGQDPSDMSANDKIQAGLAEMQSRRRSF